MIDRSCFGLTHVSTDRKPALNHLVPPARRSEFPRSGKIGVRPVPASFSSRYLRTSSRNRSPNATCVNPSATACETAARMRFSYSSFVQGQGSGTVRSGTPAASACASSSRPPHRVHRHAIELLVHRRQQPADFN